jgi:hypothetical protein
LFEQFFAELLKRFGTGVGSTERTNRHSVHLILSGPQQHPSHRSCGWAEQLIITLPGNLAISGRGLPKTKSLRGYARTIYATNLSATASFGKHVRQPQE